MMEMSTTEWIITIILFVVLIIIIIVGLILFLYTYLSNKIHDSYHEGYNKAKSDKVQYYKTIKELTDSFNIIFNELTKEGSGYMYKASTLELMLDFKKSLQEYYSN